MPADAERARRTPARPVPGRSGTSARRSGASRSAVGRRYLPEMPIPWTKTSGSPVPSSRQKRSRPATVVRRVATRPRYPRPPRWTSRARSCSFTDSPARALVAETERALATGHPLHPIDLPGFGGAATRFALGDAPAYVEEKLDEVGRAHPRRTLARRSRVRARRGASTRPRRPARARGARRLAAAALVPRARASARRGAAHREPFVPPPRRRRLAPRRADDGVACGARELLREDVLADLHAITAPTLLVWGERDPLVPPSVGELFRAELPHARLELVRGARHVPMVERPMEFCRLLTDFLP